MKVRYIINSYKRPYQCITQKEYPFFSIAVHEFEAKEYEKENQSIIVLPDKIRGNIARVKNYLIDNLMDGYDAMIIADDDIKGVYRWEEQRRIKLNEEELQEAVEQMAIICKEYGFKMFGVNPNTDKGSYREYTPLSTLAYMSSSFIGHLKENEIRYDEGLPLKEDFDMTLQQVHRYGGCLRFNHTHFDAKQSEQPGGCATYRSLEIEKEQFVLLQKKWGEEVVKRDMKSKRSFDYNPMLSIPLRGI